MKKLLIMALLASPLAYARSSHKECDNQAARIESLYYDLWPQAEVTAKEICINDAWASRYMPLIKACIKYHRNKCK